MTQPLIAARAGDDLDEEAAAAAEKVRAQPKTVTRDLAAREACTKSPSREWAAHHAATGRLMRDDSPPSAAILRAMADRKAREAQREAELAAERERANLRYRDLDAALDALFDLDIATRTLCALSSCRKPIRGERSTKTYCDNICKQGAYRERVGATQAVAAPPLEQFCVEWLPPHGLKSWPWPASAFETFPEYRDRVTLRAA
jgi:hypothetical protein